AAVALGQVTRFFSRMQVPARDVRTEPSARRAVLDGGERAFHVRDAAAASISLTTASWPSHGCRQCTYRQVRRATWWVPPGLPRALQSLERMSTSPCQERVVRPCKEQRYRSAGWLWRHHASGRRHRVSWPTEELHHGNGIRRGQPHRPLDEGHGPIYSLLPRGV